MLNQILKNETNLLFLKNASFDEPLKNTYLQAEDL